MGRGWRGRKPSWISSMTMISLILSHPPVLSSAGPHNIDLVLGIELSRHSALNASSLAQCTECWGSRGSIRSRRNRQTHQHQPTISRLKPKHIGSYQLQSHPYISSRQNTKESSRSKEKEVQIPLFPPIILSPVGDKHL